MSIILNHHRVIRCSLLPSCGLLAYKWGAILNLRWGGCCHGHHNKGTASLILLLVPLLCWLLQARSGVVIPDESCRACHFLLEGLGGGRLL